MRCGALELLELRLTEDELLRAGAAVERAEEEAELRLTVDADERLTVEADERLTVDADERLTVEAEEPRLAAEAEADDWRETDAD